MKLKCWNSAARTVSLNKSYENIFMNMKKLFNIEFHAVGIFIYLCISLVLSHAAKNQI